MLSEARNPSHAVPVTVIRRNAPLQPLQPVIFRLLGPVFFEKYNYLPQWVKLADLVFDGLYLLH